MAAKGKVSGLPKIVLMTTGGTIGTATDYGSRITGAELLGMVPGLDGVATVALDEADARPSPSITPQEMLALARRAASHLANPDVDGIVVTYGTDAIDEFIYLLHLSVDSPKPVVVTGAMYHTKGPYPDGPRNLFYAIMTAAEPAAAERGTMLVMNGIIHSARDAVKVNSASVEAFASPRYGPLGAIEANRVAFRRRETREEVIPTSDIEPDVDIIAASVGMDGRFVDASVAAGARGIVVAAMGGGALPEAMYRRLGELAKTGFPIVVTTRCIKGSVLGLPGAAVPIIPGGDLPAHKARIKLMLGLAAVRNLPPEEASTCLRRYFGA